MRETDKFYFFWRHQFGQWTLRNMTAPDGITYNCCEQYMMYQKAMLLGDRATAEKILAEPEPAMKKDLGRQVHHFDSVLSTDTRIRDWDALRKHVRCGYCNGHIRHDVVLFNEMLDRTRITAARKAIRNCELVLVVGTSNLIYPAAELPHYAMKRQRFVVEVNPLETPLSAWVSARVSRAVGEEAVQTN